MSEKILIQYSTLVGAAAIPKKLLAVPTPTKEDAGKFIKAGSNGQVEWADTFPQPTMDDSGKMLTAKSDGSTEWTDVSSLIDAKLGVIENGSY